MISKTMPKHAPKKSPIPRLPVIGLDLDPINATLNNLNHTTNCYCFPSLYALFHFTTFRNKNSHFTNIFIMTQTTPLLPWKTKLAVSLITAFSDAARRSNLTVNRRILSIVDFRAPPSTSHSVTSSDVTVDPSRNLWFRLYKPATSADSSGTTQYGDVRNEESGLLPVVVFFHGGGFAYLSADTKAYDVVCRRFAKRINAIVVSVNYRLAPEHKFPSQYDDGFDVLKFLDDNHSTILPRNADVTKIFLAGDSAGANLAHHVAVRWSRVSFKAVRIIGLISIQPFFGGEERTESEKNLVGAPLISVGRTDWSWKAFMGEGMSRDHYAVNVSGPNAEDISGMEYPDTVVFVGGFDPLKDWQIRYYEWLRKSGKNATLIEYPNMIHAFYVFPELPESGRLIHQVKDFVDRTIKK